MNQRDLDLFLLTTEARFARTYTLAIQELLLARATMNRDRGDAAFARLNSVMLHAFGLGEAFGAQVLLRTAAGMALDVYGGARFGADLREMVAFRESADILANVTLQEALDDLVTRTPKVLRGSAERTAEVISHLYSKGRVIAFARSADAVVTERVQSLFAAAIKDGTAEAQVGRFAVLEVEKVREETAAWTEAYARMAFRTNLSTAVTAGRFRQAQDPVVKRIMPAFRFDAVNDADTRPNHAAHEGVIWSVDNPQWQKHAPPLGYNCRCTLVAVSIRDLKRMGRVQPDGTVIESPVPPGAFPDPGFRHAGRPDLLQVTNA